MTPTMLDAESALAMIRAEATPLASERVATAAALGRFLADSIEAGVDLPPFANAAMDGFALRCAGAVLRAGSEFEVTGSIAAGDVVAGAVAGAWRIMTGAPVPEGLDGVVPIEQVEVLARDVDGAPLRVRLASDVISGQHIRRAGEDVARGQLVLAAGARLSPEALALATALGVGEMSVRRRPRVAVICTGRELVDDAALPLRQGQIRNANGPYLAAALPAYGAEVVLQATVPDHVEPFLAALQRAVAVGSDVVLSTGAVSMGEFDFVPEALARVGATTLFHKVRVRPGKPLLFARLPAGPLFFGLPGNPVATAVGLRFFVSAALRVFHGLEPEVPLRLPLRIECSTKSGLRLFAKARVSVDGLGSAAVEILDGQESFRLAPLLQANAWAVLPGDHAVLGAGDTVDVYPLGPDGRLP